MSEMRPKVKSLQSIIDSFWFIPSSETEIYLIYERKIIKETDFKIQFNIC